MSTPDEARIVNVSMAVINMLRQPGTGLTRGEAAMALMFAVAELCAGHDPATRENMKAELHKLLDQMIDAQVKGVRT